MKISIDTNLQILSTYQHEVYISEFAPPRGLLFPPLVAILHCTILKTKYCIKFTYFSLTFLIVVEDLFAY